MLLAIGLPALSFSAMAVNLVKSTKQFCAIRKTKTLTVFCFLAASLANASNGWAKAETAWSGSEKYFKSRGILNYSDDSSAALKKTLEEEISLEEKNIQSTDDNIAREAKENLKFYKFAIKKNELCADKSINQEVRKTAFNEAKRILFSIKSKLFSGDNKKGVVLEVIFREYLNLKNYTGSELKAVIGDKDAVKEATNLIHPNGRSYTTSELALMTPVQISEIDIGKDHLMWHSQEKMASGFDSWSFMEDYVTKHATKEVKKNSKNFEGKYDLAKARNVVFFSSIKASATSPKINVKDIYGGKWKLKWSVEVQPETISTRLYAKVGAKFFDLVYPSSLGFNGTVLILDKAKPEDKSCESIDTYEKLRKCMLNSTYNFDLREYAHSHGVVTSENVETIFKGSIDKNLKAGNPEDYIGREYVTFKKALLEYKFDQGFTRGGPVSLGKYGAEEDRVSRGLMLFNMWIQNYDAKDDNARSVLAKDFSQKDSLEYFEFFHDLGASLGERGEAGLFNDLKTDEDFIKTGSGLTFKNFLNRLIIIPGKSRIFFPVTTIYSPAAWSKATFSDARWMALKIAQVKRVDLEKIVALTDWPDFAQKAFVNKLINRRDRIGEIFAVKINDVLSENVLDFDLSVDLFDQKVREEIARKYNLPEKELLAMAQKGKQTKGIKKEYLVKNGQIASCEDSAVINLLEKYNYPEGISRKHSRSSDDKPLPRCEFAKRKDHLGPIHR